MLSFKPTFSLSSFTFIKRLFSFSSLSAIRVVSSAYLRLLIFLPAINIRGKKKEQEDENMLHHRGHVRECSKATTSGTSGMLRDRNKGRKPAIDWIH